MPGSGARKCELNPHGKRQLFSRRNVRHNKRNAVTKIEPLKALQNNRRAQLKCYKMSTSVSPPVERRSFPELRHDFSPLIFRLPFPS